MATDALGEALGETGVAGVAAICLGLLLLARENRRAALAAVVVLAGHVLLAHGLLGAFLRSMGMEYEDLV